MKTKRTWFEVTDGNMGKDFSTKKEAQADLEQMTLGYPEKKHMSEENHSYWAKHSTACFITKVVQTTEKVK